MDQQWWNAYRTGYNLESTLNIPEFPTREETDKYIQYWMDGRRNSAHYIRTFNVGDAVRLAGKEYYIYCDYDSQKIGLVHLPTGETVEMGRYLLNGKDVLPSNRYISSLLQVLRHLDNFAIPQKFHRWADEASADGDMVSQIYCNAASLDILAAAKDNNIPMPWTEKYLDKERNKLNKLIIQAQQERSTKEEAE